MYKLKYYTLTKDEQKQIKKEFYKTEYGCSLNNRLNRLLLTGIFGIIFSIFLFILHSNKWDIVTGILLLIASLIFIIGSHKVRINKINVFLTKNKK